MTPRDCSRRCLGCDAPALPTATVCAKCGAWSDYGRAIAGRGDPAAFAAGVGRFMRYQRAQQPAPMPAMLRSLHRRIKALENSLEAAFT